MYVFTIRYLKNGFSEEFETDAENILIALGNFVKETGNSIDDISSVEC